MRVLVFLPGDESRIGIWQPHVAQVWQDVTVPRVQGEGNRILQALDSCLTAAGISLHDLTHIGVMHGPATYTELRLHVTTANTLAWSLHLPLFSFDPDTVIPDAIPTLLPQAKVNVPVMPLYPHDL